MKTREQEIKVGDEVMLFDSFGTPDKLVTVTAVSENAIAYEIKYWFRTQTFFKSRRYVEPLLTSQKKEI